jgi:hypothetical protein
MLQRGRVGVLVWPVHAVDSSLQGCLGDFGCIAMNLDENLCTDSQLRWAL